MRFPLTGTAVEICDWLRSQSFKEATIQNFEDWNAEAMLGGTESDIKADIPVKDGRRLWALLNTAKSTQGKLNYYLSDRNV